MNNKFSQQFEVVNDNLKAAVLSDEYEMTYSSLLVIITEDKRYAN